MLGAKNSPTLEWLRWLGGDLYSAGKPVAAYLAQKCDLAGLVEMSRSMNAETDFLLVTIAKMTGLGRRERVSAMKQIVHQDIERWGGVGSAEHGFVQLLKQDDLATVELMIAAGVPWKNVLFTAGINRDRSTLDKLLKCQGVEPYDLLRTPDFREVANFIAYSVVKRDVLDEAPSVLAKLHAMNGLLRQDECYREGAKALLRDELKAGNTSSQGAAYDDDLSCPIRRQVLSGR